MAAGAPGNTFVLEEKGKVNEPKKEKELGTGVCPPSGALLEVLPSHFPSHLSTPSWKGVLGMA